MVFFSQIANGFGVGEVLVLHQEGNSIPAFATTEVFPYLLYRRNHKAGRPLVRERTQSFVIRTSAFELDEVADDFLHPHLVVYFIYGIFWNHCFLD